MGGSIPAAAEFNLSYFHTLPSDQLKMDYVLGYVQMPSGWQRAVTQSGEVYFINHNSRTTCWEDPRLGLIPLFLKRAETRVNGSGEESVERIKTSLLESIERKKELVRVLEELNKKEAYLRMQLNQALMNLNGGNGSSSSSSNNNNNNETVVNDEDLGAENLTDLNLDLTAIDQENVLTVGEEVSTSITTSNNTNELEAVNTLYNKMLINSSANKNSVINSISNSSSCNEYGSVITSPVSSNNSPLSSVSSTSINSASAVHNINPIIRWS